MNKGAACVVAILLCLAVPALGADFFVSPSGGNVPPFATWDSAATNIQDAIDAAAAGDTVWVTNGVYASGGKVMAADLTNRVVLDKALTVQSVNGPFATVIQGQWDPVSTNGPLAVRCAWLTNSAVLKGFALFGGATRNAGTQTTLENGGGVWCSSTNASVANCILVTNTAYANGCAAYGGTLNGCAVLENVGGSTAGATYGANLASCTVVSNVCGGGYVGNFTNSILYYNVSHDNSSATLAYCCSTAVLVGYGNFSAPPQLLADGIHLASTSPCIAVGTNWASGVDIDGQPWAVPRAIGCDEWYGPPLLKTQAKVAYTVDPVGFSIGVTLVRADPLTAAWFKDGTPLADGTHLNGTQTTNLSATGISIADAGAYELILSNTWGTTTSAVQVVVHCVDGAGTNPVSPFLDWSSAATHIQDAIDAALPGEIVLVTNGVYASGGKVPATNLLSRVVLDKALMVQSVNGSSYTAIQGAWDPSTTNGPLAVRCAWLTNGAVLSGFTLQGGATADATAALALRQGGGVYGNASNATLVANCVLRGNNANYSGGGTYHCGLYRCLLTGNRSVSYGGGAESSLLTNCSLVGNFASIGGGADASTLRNCALTKNAATSNGGGAYNGTLFNCTIASNTVGGTAVPATAGGAFSCKLTNCVVYANRNLYSALVADSNYFNGTFSYSCSAPLPSGPGNISVDPQLLSDGIHLAPGSPCRGAGLASVLSGSDIDGQPWTVPPSIGCDEWSAVPVVGLPVQTGLMGFPSSLSLWAMPVGHDPLTCFWLKDEALLQDGTKYTGSQSTNLIVSTFGPPDGGAYQLVASNAFGMATSAVVVVVVHCADAAALDPAPPYSDWPTAAATIQDAVDAANWGDFVLVTNGIYATGGHVMAGDLTNRLAVNKPISVSSVNGPGAAAVVGEFDPVTGTGPLALRCAWIGMGATLRGFTLQRGATRNSGDVLLLESGGGVWCPSTNEMLISCVLSNNAAAYLGGGVYQGQLQRCIAWANSAPNGGGAANSVLATSLIRSNTATQFGGGVYECALVACTVNGNQAPFSQGGGEYLSKAWNSIVYDNVAPAGIYSSDRNDWDLASKPLLVSCWTSSDYYNNTTPSPQVVLDGLHLAATSPCRGAGTSLYASGTDFDGEPWLNPPSIGCDEYYAADFTGPLFPGPLVVRGVWSPPVLRNAQALAYSQLAGNADRVTWSLGDGTVVTNLFILNVFHTWTNAGDFNVTFTAYNADNPNGVATNLPVHVALPDAPQLTCVSPTGGTFVVSFPLQGGVTYYVDQATNLALPVLWQPYASVIATFSPSANFTNSAATNPAGFYRVRVK